MPDPSQLAAFFDLSVLQNPFSPPYQPSPKQAMGLLCPELEIFFGGAGGGGKSDWLLRGAIQYFDVPGYAALILRRTFPDLSQPGAIMHRSHYWWGKGGITPGAGLPHWNADQHIWTFPAHLTRTVNGPAYRGPQWGMQLRFGHLDSDRDKYSFRGAEYQFIGFDELTDFLETQYRFLFTRLRGVLGLDIPTRMWSASNPGGPGHEWVYRRMVLGSEGNVDRRFIPARIYDNPGLDAKAYVRSLKETDPITRLQLLEGNWVIKARGNKFRRGDFEVVEKDAVPAGAFVDLLRYWDMAATDPRKMKGKSDPDYTAGCKVGQHQGVFYVFGMERDRTSPEGVTELVRSTAYGDGKQSAVYIEQEGGSEGKIAIDYFQRIVLKGFEVYGHHPTAPKEIRAAPVISASHAGNIKLVNMGPGRNEWIEPFLDELEAFGAHDDNGKVLWQHDDQVDALTGAVAMLVERGEVYLDIDVPVLTGAAWHDGLGFTGEPWRGGLAL